MDCYSVSKRSTTVSLAVFIYDSAMSLIVRPYKYKILTHYINCALTLLNIFYDNVSCDRSARLLKVYRGPDVNICVAVFTIRISSGLVANEDVCTIKLIVLCEQYSTLECTATD